MIGADLWMMRKSSFFIGVPSVFFSMPLVQHLRQRGIVVAGPLVGGDIDRALRQRQHGVLMAAGEDDLAEIGVGVGDAHLVELEARHVVAGGRIRIDQAEVLALQVVDALVRARRLDEEHRVIAGRAVGIDVVGEGVGLDAGQPGAGERRRAVAGDMDVAGALAFDDGGIVVGDAQRDLDAEFLGEIGRRTASSARSRPRRFPPERPQR